MALSFTEDGDGGHYPNSIMLGRLLATNATHDDHTTTTTEQPDNENDTIFPEIYQSMVFLLALYVCGDFLCGKVIRIVPPLVGQIAVGILVGPHGWDLVSDASSCWPLLGELGLVLMLCQAGLEMDFEVLQAVGPRGAFMALVGSILPSSIGFLLAHFVLDLSPTAALAVGCSFGPTSAGIALNVLQQCDNVLRTPLGQLIVAIAIVDDIIALVVLSQLQALLTTTEDSAVSAASIAIPIVSALLWLFLGGAVALYAMPRILQWLTSVEESIFVKLSSNNSSGSQGKANSEGRATPKSIHVAHIIVLLFALLPATYYSQASHLLGAFLAGLSVCQQADAARSYHQELGKIVTWLMRIFFGASIAFRIPVALFQDANVIGRGFLLSLSLLGKILTGPLLTPVHLQVPTTTTSTPISEDPVDNNNNNHREDVNHPTNAAMVRPPPTPTATRHCYDRQHLRDCLVVGFSMAGEAEFAMLVAAFGFTEGLVEEDIYASTIFAILLSTILSPCLLRLTLALFPSSSSIELDDSYGNEDHEQQEEVGGDRVEGGPICNNNGKESTSEDERSEVG